MSTDSAEPLATVVMLNLNGIDYIEEVLHAVFAQTAAPRLEVVLVDQGSTDGSRELVQQRFGDRLELLVNSTNTGASAGHNLAMSRARGRYILRLDSDAVPVKAWAEELLSAAEGDPTLGMCTSKILMYHDRRRIDCVGHNMWPDGLNRSRGNFELDSGQYEEPEETLLASGCAALYRRDAIDGVGGLDEDFVVYGDDAEVGMRIRLQGWRCLYVPTAVVHHHGGSGIGAVSLEKIFLVERNRIWVMLKTFPASWIIASPWYTALRLAGGWVAARGGGGIAGRVVSSHSRWLVARTILRAWWAGLRGAPAMLAKRRAILAESTMDARQIAALLREFRATGSEMRFGEVSGVSPQPTAR
jgi:GT2 family glycosyltransferase